jgi:hypothetical protein
MNARNLVINGYLRLLRIFPERYRAEYGPELEFAIRQLVEENAQRGRLPLIRLAWRELRDLPVAILREHAKERRRRKMEADSYGTPLEEPVSGRKILAAFTPFLIVLLYQLFDLLQIWRWIHESGVLILLIGLLSILLVPVVSGTVRGLPRWAIPSMGLLVGIIGELIFNSWVDTLPPQFHLSSVGEEISFAVRIHVIFYGHILLLSALMVLGTAWLPSFRVFRRSLRRDWSTLSFLLYGSTLVGLLRLDEYQGSEPYRLAGLLILAVGAWVYLRRSQPASRLGALLAAVLLAMGLEATGTYVLYPRQAWIVHATFPRWWETLAPVIEGVVLMVIICAPAALSLLPANPGLIPRIAEDP